MGSYYDPLHPAVLHRLQSVAQDAQSGGVSLSICGEMEGNPVFTELLIGFGYRNFSVNPGDLLEIKNTIRGTDLCGSETLAREILELSTVKEIKERLFSVSPPLTDHVPLNESAFFTIRFMKRKISPKLAILIVTLTGLSNGGVAQSSDPGKAVAPKTTINLLADPEFKNFTANINQEKEPRDNPRDIWKMGNDGILKISSRGWGYIRTNTIFRDYHLVLEYTWGEKTWASVASDLRLEALPPHRPGQDRDRRRKQYRSQEDAPENGHVPSPEFHNR